MLRKCTIPTAAAVLLHLTFGQAFAEQAQGQPGRLETLIERLADADEVEGDWVAEQLMELWAESGSRSTSYLYQRGIKAMRAEDFEAAIEHFTAAIDHAPQFGQAYFSRGNIFLQIGEHGLALEDFLRATSYIPEHYEAYFGIGVTLEQMGESEAALKAMRQSYLLNPHREDLADFIEKLEVEVEGRKT